MQTLKYCSTVFLHVYPMDCSKLTHVQLITLVGDWHVSIGVRVYYSMHLETVHCHRFFSCLFLHGVLYMYVPHLHITLCFVVYCHRMWCVHRVCIP